MISPLRIVSLLSSATEIVCALGLCDQLRAISHECDFPPDVSSKLRATFSNVNSQRSSQAIDEQVKTLLLEQRPLYEIDRALVRQLKPTLLITQSQCDVCAVKYTDVLDFVRSTPELQNTQLLSLNPTSLEEVLTDVHRISIATDTLDVGECLIAGYRARIDAIRLANGSLPVDLRPRVVCIEWTEPLMVAANWTPQLLEWAGGQPGLAVAGQHTGYTSWESFIEFDPEVIIVSACGFNLPRTILEAKRLTVHPAWPQLSAVRNDRVFAVDGNAYLNRSGPRLVESLEILAHLIQPERFPPPQSLSSNARDFCQLRVPLI